MCIGGFIFFWRKIKWNFRPTISIGSKYIYSRSWLTKMDWNIFIAFWLMFISQWAWMNFAILTGFKNSHCDLNITASRSAAFYCSKTTTFLLRIKQDKEVLNQISHFRPPRRVRKEFLEKGPTKVILYTRFSRKEANIFDPLIRTTLLCVKLNSKSDHGNKITTENQHFTIIHNDCAYGNPSH